MGLTLLQSLLFVGVLVTGITPFVRRVSRIRANILRGRGGIPNDRAGKRWRQMARVALGQSKMGNRPVAAFFHILIYAGFVLINLELLEIVLDGVLGTHRILAKPLGAVYPWMIGSFEFLGLGVVIACLVFLWRRNVQGPARLFKAAELQGWPALDANLILLIELVLMGALFLMNAADMAMHPGDYVFPVSGLIAVAMQGWSMEALYATERIAWWLHIGGIIGFLNYLPYSKHFHIILAFPNTWYASLEPAGTMSNMPVIQQEVKAMLDPQSAPASVSAEAPARFGAKDVHDLPWKSLLDAYSCTECGRCTSVCPANLTGKKLSPRQIMMSTRDRLEEAGQWLEANPGTATVEDNRSLLGDFISTEEILACTSCNACVEACPVLINPLNIILELRRYRAMEAGEMPSEWVLMQSNIENNGAPWAFPAADRGAWTLETLNPS
jgi:heterodisulfide reductase subunit C